MIGIKMKRGRESKKTLRKEVKIKFFLRIFKLLKIVFGILKTIKIISDPSLLSITKLNAKILADISVLKIVKKLKKN